MIRQPAIETAADILNQAFTSVSVNYGRQRTLNLAAQLRGYKNYAHYKAEAPRKENSTTPAPVVTVTALVDAAAPAPATAREEALAIALEWMVSRFEGVLSRTPVRDADECLLHAKLLLNPRKK